MADVTHPGLDVVLTATDLATTNAVRFGSTRSGCSRYGTITEPIHVATAVAASAAYPALLPALERTFTFERRNGHSSSTPCCSLTAVSTTTSGCPSSTRTLTGPHPARLRRTFHHRLRRRTG